MTKPIGPICNLDCSYCFYLEKESFYETKGNAWRMSEEVLDTYIRQYIEAQPTNEVDFAWQGGEPTLLGLSYFQKVIELQQKYANGKTIRNAFQTNGFLLNDDWCSFFKENDFLIGISIDGPEAIHDEYRVDKQGRGTWAKVMKGLECLKKHSVEFNTLTCVHRKNAHKGEQIYKFLKGIGSKYLQFIPIVERYPETKAGKHDLAPAPDIESLEDNPLRVTPWTVKPVDYGQFLCTIFDLWIKKDVGKIYVQMFDTALAKWLRMPSGVCLFQETCGRALAIEHNGDLYSCDHFVYEDYKLGNLLNTSLGEMVESNEQKKFGHSKLTQLPKQCRECDVRFACNGECPKKRFAITKDGEPGLNYLCEGYYKFFKHVDPYIHVMAELLRNGKYADEIMQLIKDKRIKI